MKIFLKLASAATLIVSMGVQADFIDLFEDPVVQTVSDVVNGPGDGAGNLSESTSASFPTTILGGFRDMRVDALSGAIDAITGTATTTDICNTGDSCSVLTVSTVDGKGQLRFSNDTPDVIGEAEVQWDGGNGSGFDEDGLIGKTVRPDGDATKGADFVNQAGCPVGGCDRLTFTVIAADLGFIFTVGIYTDDDEFTEFDLISTGTAGSRDLLFSDFQIPGLCAIPAGGFPAGSFIEAIRCGSSGLVDFTNVGAMRIVLNAADQGGVGTRTAAVDLTIGGITKTGVPEPGILALLGIGLAAGALARRRKIA